MFVCRQLLVSQCILWRCAGAFALAKLGGGRLYLMLGCVAPSFAAPRSRRAPNTEQCHLKNRCLGTWNAFHVPKNVPAGCFVGTWNAFHVPKNAPPAPSLAHSNGVFRNVERVPCSNKRATWVFFWNVERVPCSKKRATWVFVWNVERVPCSKKRATCSCSGPQQGCFLERGTRSMFKTTCHLGIFVGTWNAFQVSQKRATWAFCWNVERVPCSNKRATCSYSWHAHH